MELFRAADLVEVDAGPGGRLVHSRDTGLTRRLEPELADAIRRADRWAPLASLPAPGPRRAADTAALRELAAEGFLVRAEEADRRPEPPAARVTRLAAPTCDRPGLLGRAVASFLANGRRAGRTTPVLVGDDSADPAPTRRVLTELAERHDTEIRHLDAAGKRDLCRELSAAAGVPERIVGFLVTPARPGTGRAATTVGANRNALLLATVGELVVCADDDVTCRVAGMPGRRRGARVRTGGGGTGAVPFRDRAESTAAVPETDADLLALHEEWLGRRPPASHGAGVDLSATTPGTVRQLRHRDCTVLLTLPGFLGDCAWDNPDAGLAGGSGAVTSREWLQGVDRVTLTPRPEPVFGVCLGWDGRALLPPHPPVGRAEDVAFGTLFASCLPDAYAAYLPWAVLHDPPERRGFDQPPAYDVGPGLWIAAVLAGADPGLDRDPGRRLDAVGRRLADLSRLGGPDFEDFLRLQALDSLQETVSRQFGPIERLDGGQREQVLRSVDRLTAAVLAPVGSRYTGPDGRAGAQRLLGTFGEALSAWPAVVAAARRLRAGGREWGTPVSPS